jgi:hypothetical protein
MNADAATLRRADTDPLLTRMARWVAVKVWVGCVLSGVYAAGRHYGWPEGLRTLLGVAGALALALAVLWLPVWTHRPSTGIVFIDRTLRLIVWASLTASVVALLVGFPALGAVAGALFLTTAGRTFHPQLAPLISRVR